jgi:hypothetical protein
MSQDAERHAGERERIGHLLRATYLGISVESVEFSSLGPPPVVFDRMADAVLADRDADVAKAIQQALAGARRQAIEDVKAKALYFPRHEFGSLAQSANEHEGMYLISADVLETLAAQKEIS